MAGKLETNTYRQRSYWYKINYMPKGLKGFQKGNKIGKGRKRLPFTLSEELKKKLSIIQLGIKEEDWNGFTTPENDKIRGSIEYRLWREAVFARDNWTCQKCKVKGGTLHPHHIQNFAQFPELRFAIDNGITFCKEHHKEFHRSYGIKNNNQEQVLIYGTQH